MKTATSGQIQLKLQANTVPPTLVLAYLVEFRKSYPDIRFALSIAEAGAIEAELIADRLQFGLVHALQSRDFLAGINLGTLRTVAVASPGYLAQDGERLATVEGILAADIIDIDPSLPLLRQWYGEAAPAETQASFLVPDSGSAADAAAQGGGVAFVSESLARPRIAHGQLVQLPDPLGVPALPLLLAYRKKNSRQLLESLFLEYLMDLEPS